VDPFVRIQYTVLLGCLQLVAYLVGSDTALVISSSIDRW
jgi:hypothetical protein